MNARDWMMERVGRVKLIFPSSSFSLIDAVKLIGKVTNLSWEKIHKNVQRWIWNWFNGRQQKSLPLMVVCQKSSINLFQSIFWCLFVNFFWKFKGIPRAQMLRIASNSYLEFFLSLARCCKNYEKAATLCPKKSRYWCKGRKNPLSLLKCFKPL